MSLPPSPQIGRTTLIGVRDAVGGNEDTHFTPWLARNIDVLGELLGVQLRVLEPGEEDLAFGRHIEVPVGGFYLDIRAVDRLARPNGSIYVKPEGRRYAPFYMWINSKKRAMVTGAWANYVTVANHPGFGPVAEFLGQDHLAKGATGRPLADLEVEGFWEAAMSSSRQINTTPANPERDPDSWQNSAGAL